MAGIKGAENVQVGIGQIIGIASAGLQLLALFRQARDQWKTQNPEAEVPEELTDEFLIGALEADSDTLIATAQRLQQKYATPTA
jgi:hypothetical protein